MIGLSNAKSCEEMMQSAGLQLAREVAVPECFYDGLKVELSENIESEEF
jgi:hypothetical protein